MKRGFTLLEVLVSIAILTMLAAAVFPVIGWYITKSRQYQYDSEAAGVLQEANEAAYNYFLAKADWSFMNTGLQYVPVVNAAGSTPVWELRSDVPNTVGRFKRWIEVKTVCRNETTGAILRNSDGSINCTDPLTLDAKSLMMQVHVTWEEKGVLKPLTSELLLVKI